MTPAESAFIKTYLAVTLPACAAGIAVMAAFWLPGELTWTRFIAGGVAGVVAAPGVATLIGWRKNRNA